MNNEVENLQLSIVELSSNPLFADVQYRERFTSESLNRKFHGVMEAGVYRGFNAVNEHGLTLTFCKDTSKNTAVVELDKVTMTVQGYSPVTVTLKAGMVNVVVLEANYKIGEVTTQVDRTSKIPAAIIKVVSESQVKQEHVILCKYKVPTSAATLDKSMIVAGGRSISGVSAITERVKNLATRMTDSATTHKTDISKLETELTNVTKETDKKISDLKMQQIAGGNLSETVKKQLGTVLAATSKTESELATLKTETSKNLSSAIKNVETTHKTDISKLETELTNATKATDKKISDLKVQQGTGSALSGDAKKQIETELSKKYDKTGGVISGSLEAKGGIKSGGDIYAVGNVVAYSDQRIKSNIKQIPTALDKVLKLSGVTYDRLDINCDRQTGLIAQQVEAVLPEAVLTSKNELLGIDDFKSVNYGSMIGLLVEAIKELNEKLNRMGE